MTLIRGDALRLPLRDECVDLCVTSPPYFALRSYQDGGGHYAGQVGSEATPREFLEALWAATAEMVRVLKPSGSLFINLGDKYGGSGGHNNSNIGGTGRGPSSYNKSSMVRDKSLMGLPWLYANGCTGALAALGGPDPNLNLIHRAELVWSKPNGLPESVTDRVRRSHEQWFHFTREPRYYSAVDEIREAHIATETGRDMSRWATGPPDNRGLSVGKRSSDGSPVGEFAINPLGKLPGSVWTIPTEPLQVPAYLQVDHFAAFPQEWPRRIILGWSPPGICLDCGEGRRPEVATVGLDMSRPQAKRAHELAEAAGLTDEHFAALLSVGVSDTGRGAATQTGTGKNTPEVYRLADEARDVLGGYAREYLLRRPTSFGYVCACPQPTAPTTPAVVLDPFAGTGTVPMVARALGRMGVGVDLSSDYLRLARWRIYQSGHASKTIRRTNEARQGALL